MAPPAHLVDFYRADSWPRMRCVLIAGPVLLTLGALVVPVAFATREPAAMRELADIVGLLLIAGGASLTMAGLHGLLRDDAYLALRTDGVLFQSASLEAFVPWDDLVGARWDGARPALLLERRGGEVVVVPRRFARLDGPALAERIERARRRASLGIDWQ